MRIRMITLPLRESAEDFLFLDCFNRFTSEIRPDGLLVYIIIQLIQKNRKYNRIDHLRYDDSSQIEENMNTAADHKGSDILVESEADVTDADQKERCLDIVIIKDPIAVAGHISDPGIDQRIIAKQPSSKQIKQDSG